MIYQKLKMKIIRYDEYILNIRMYSSSDYFHGSTYCFLDSIRQQKHSKASFDVTKLNSLKHFITIVYAIIDKSAYVR